MNTRLNFRHGRKPNVIWVLSDQLRVQSLGYRGDLDVRTPNIDNLARRGMRFDNAVSGAPWCTPFRGALLTGLYPHQSGVDRTPSRLDKSIPTITKPFQEAGYHTAWVGKWHLDGSNSREHYVAPDRRGGFEYWMGYENNNNQHEVYAYGTDHEEPVRLEGYETDALTNIFIQHMQAHVNASPSDDTYEPFFAVLSVQPPHDPYMIPTVTSSDYYHNPASITYRPNVPLVDWVRDQVSADLSGYYGMIENLDMNLGRIRNALRDLDIDRETYIFFFSDHGDCLGSHGQWGKSSPWEESIRIPFIIHSVSELNSGTTDVVLNHVDIAPTTLGLCGIDTPEYMMGFDYSYILKPSRNDVQRSGVPYSAYLQQIPAKYHVHSVNRPWRGIVTRDGWKYVCFPEQDWLLFDTVRDPYEMANLCFDIAFEEQRKKCHELLSRWINETEDKFSLPPL